MLIKRIVVGELQENCYLLVNKDGYAIVIDPGAEASKIIQELTSYCLEEVLITHHHFDHIGALDELEKYLAKNKSQGKKHFNYMIIPTPGHTSDSVSFYFPEEHIVFTGDFIFKGTIGRMESKKDQEQMKQSIEAFLRYFKEDVVIYPGHGPQTSLKNEQNNLRRMLEYL